MTRLAILLLLCGVTACSPSAPSPTPAAYPPPPPILPPAPHAAPKHHATRADLEKALDKALKALNRNIDDQKDQ